MYVYGKDALLGKEFFVRSGSYRLDVGTLIPHHEVYYKIVRTGILLPLFEANCEVIIVIARVARFEIRT